MSQKLTKSVSLVRVNRRDPTLQRRAKRWTDQVRRDAHGLSSFMLCVYHVRVEPTLEHSFTGNRAALLRLRHRPDQRLGRQQDRNEQTGLRKVQQTTEDAPRPRVRPQRVRQGRVQRDEVVPLAVRHGQQEPVVLLLVLRQRGAHSPISPTLPRCSVANRFADVASFYFLFFAVAGTRGRSGEDVRELPVYQDLQVAPLRRRTRWLDLPPMPLQGRKLPELPERVPQRIQQAEKAEESLSVDDPTPVFSFLETPHDPEPIRNLIRDDMNRDKQVK